MKKFIFTTILALSVLSVNAADYSGRQYDSTNAQNVHNVDTGTVVSMREIEIQGSTDLAQYTGAGLGGVLGGIVGNTVGNGGAKTNVATVALAALGAIGGNYVTQAIYRERGYEYIIKTDKGTIAISQAMDSSNAINIGDNVRIIYGNKVRVIKQS